MVRPPFASSSNGASGVVTAEQPLTARAGVIVPADAPATRPYFSRASIGETRYTVLEPDGDGASVRPAGIYGAAVEL